MNCVTCKQPNAPDRNYCGACGTLLTQFCSLCGFRNGKTDRFCGGCGGELGTGAQGGAARGEATEVQPGPQARPTGGPVSSGASLAELLHAAEESAEVAAEESDVKVSQEDIDALFGE
jgi:hypothetical protein